VYVNIEFSTIETLRDYYIRLDNYWHQTEHLNKAPRPAIYDITTNSNTVSRTILAAVFARTAVVPAATRVTPASRAITPAINSGNTCYTCGSPNHFAKDCLTDKRFIPRASVAPGQVSEVHQDEKLYFNKQHLIVPHQNTGNE